MLFWNHNTQQFSHKGTKAQRRDVNYKTLSKREESIAEKRGCSIVCLLKMALNELYYNLSVFVTLWLNYYSDPLLPGEKIARHRMVAFEFDQIRTLLLADLHGVGASGVKSASGGRCNQIGDVALDAL